MRYFQFIFLLFAFRPAAAQVCTGGLGDPIVNITFGSGAGTGLPLGAGVTNLTYINNQCPNDGYYTIASRTSGCFSGSWQTVTQDHTGNPNGYFMLINASVDPSDFYVQRVDGLCEGTTYQFAAWVLNMVATAGQILPNITFSIEKTDGTLLQQFKTGDIPEGKNWVQSAFYFATPPGISSVVIRMTNNAPGGIGNDLALDDITFRASGPAIRAATSGFTGDTVTLCANDPQILTLNGNAEACYPSAAYQWQRSLDTGKTWTDIPGANTVNYARPPAAAGLYLYRFTVSQPANLGNAFCKVSSLPVTIRVVPVAGSSLSINASSLSVCAGSPVTFTATPINGGDQPVYQWLVDGLKTGNGGAAFTTSTLSSANGVSCILTSNAFCISNRVTGSNTISVAVTPNPVTGVVVAAAATTICQDSVVTFDATPSNGGPSPSYQWQVNGSNVGMNGPVYTDGNLKDGDIVNCVFLSSIECALPISSDPPVTMTVYPLPLLHLPADTIIAAGTSIQLAPSVTGTISSWTWSPSDGLNDPGTWSPVATPIRTTTYGLKVVSDEGCQASAAETVGVFYDLVLPGAFTPNGDGHNDLFRVPPEVPVVLKGLNVYNRWGSLVFSTTSSRTGWDGNVSGHPQPAGLYVWDVEYYDPLTKQMKEKRGTVMLVR